MVGNIVELDRKKPRKSTRPDVLIEREGQTSFVPASRVLRYDTQKFFRLYPNITLLTDDDEVLDDWRNVMSNQNVTDVNFRSEFVL